VTTVDAHHHFWDPTTADYPWLTADLAPIRRAFGPADLAPLLRESRIDLTIVMQTRSSLDETREFLATAAAHPFIAGVVGWVDLTVPSVRDNLAALRAGPGGDWLVGVRHQVQDEADPEWLARADVRRGLGEVGAAGLAYDLLVRTRELPAAIDAAAALPGLRFVLDHAAKPPIASRALEPWAGLIRRLARLENVTCKLSGLVTEANWATWDPEDLRAYVETVLEAFRPSRVMFGSDWPVCLLAASYERVLDTTENLTAELTATERARVFGGTAIDAYGLRTA
jgi:L-fucono-1,5-lactonase